MNKTVFIIGGIILILLVVAVWIYLFLFGTPEKVSDIFANFGSNQNSGEVIDPSNTDNDTDTTIDQPSTQAPKRLRQITTRPVAGAVFVDESIRFMERGTGHLYEISLSGNAETLITGTTIPKVVDALFSQSGSRVAFTREENGNHVTAVGTLTKSDQGLSVLDTFTLPTGTKDPSFSSTGEELRYLKVTSSGSTGHTYNIAKKTDSTLFSLPLRDIEMVWSGNKTYLYTTPSAHTIGYLYQIEKGSPTYVTNGAPGLTALIDEDRPIVTYSTGGKLATYSINDGKPLAQPIALLHEKCVHTTESGSITYCAAPVDFPSGDYPDDWYSGKVSFSDFLWMTITNNQNATVISDLLSESGREIDVEKIGINNDDTKLYFINKNDHSLWLYDLSL